MPRVKFYEFEQNNSDGSFSTPCLLSADPCPSSQRKCWPLLCSTLIRLWSTPYSPLIPGNG